MTFIKNILRKVWQNTCFRSFSIFKNLKEGGLLTAILIPGLVFSFFYYQYEEKRISLEKNVDKALIESWKEAPNGQMYLNVYFEVEGFPLAFEKEDVESIVTKKVNIHNYRVRARASNRSVGIYVKPDARLEQRVEAIYSEEIAVNGEANPTIWLISDNTEIKDPEIKKALEEKGEKLPLRE